MSNAVEAHVLGAARAEQAQVRRPLGGSERATRPCETHRAPPLSDPRQRTMPKKSHPQQSRDPIPGLMIQAPRDSVNRGRAPGARTTPDVPTHVRALAPQERMAFTRCNVLVCAATSSTLFSRSPRFWILLSRNAMPQMRLAVFWKSACGAESQLV